MSTDAETIRKRFAAGWGRMGEAWGVTPSTANVHGYLLLQEQPLTESEIQAALGFSHRAVRVALSDCEAWGIVERAPEPRRAGSRGPAGVGWRAVPEHWEWFRRVVSARKHREADPVIAVLDDCLRATQDTAGDDRAMAAVGERLTTLLAFVHQFEVGVAAVERAEAAALGRLFGSLATLDAATIDKLLTALAGLPEEEIARFVRTVASLSPVALSRLIRLGGQPRIGRVLRRVG